MPTITFSGDPRAPGMDPAECVMFGVTFPLGQPVEVSDEIAARLRTHSHFTMLSGTVRETVTAAPATDTASPALEARHRGRGSYSIMAGDAELVEGLSKQQAADFNAMTPADREAFVGALK